MHLHSPLPSPISVSLICSLAAVMALGILNPSTVTPKAQAGGKGKPMVVPPNSFNADITFSFPKRYAVISDRAKNIKRLYATGSLIFQQKNWTPLLRIERIELQGVVFRHTKNGQKQFLQFGHKLPGLPHLILVQKVGLTELHYGFKVVDSIPDREPHLERLDGLRAYLVKEVLKDSLPLTRHSSKQHSLVSSPQELLPEEFITNVQVTQVDDDTYDVDKESLKPLHQSLRQSLANPKESLGRAISLITNNRLDLHTSVADATLSAEGFTLTRFDEAQNLGLQVGDRIISINDQSVSSPLVAWEIAARLITQNQKLTHLEIKLLREGLLKTKTYRLK